MDKELAFESKRKLVHVILTSYPLFFIYFDLQVQLALALSTSFFIVWVGSEILRVRYNLNTPTAFLIRRVSRTKMNGTLRKEWKRIRIPFWIISLTIAIAFSNYLLLLAASVTLTFGDTASAIARRALNRTDPIVGFLFGVFISAVIIYMATSNLLIALIPPIAGMAGEFISKKVDDNLTIPLFASLGFMALQILMFHTF
ncbi:MAG: hypothetical protein M1500_01145 [Candidatus Marsarchaeota archaeon]|nr:hypothetical protein [Candidatus Marsarchaeota archaeon]